MSGRYRRSLIATARAGAVAYGYTLSIWTSGAALMHEQGQPTLPDAALFLLGGVAAFALVALLANGGAREPTSDLPDGAVLPAGALHVLAAGAALGAAMLVAVTVNGDAAWPLASFLLTGLYLTIAAAEVAFFSARQDRQR